MLSNCQGCKYFQPDLCAFNPGYWKVERILRKTLTPGELNAAQMMFLPCPHWEQTVVPHPTPVEPLATPYSRRPPRDLDEQQMAQLVEQLGSRPVRRKNWQERLLDAIYFVDWIFANLSVSFLNTITTKTLFMLGIVLLSVSDPQFSGALPGLPQIPDGYAYAQLLCMGVIMYQTSHWALAIKRGEFASTRHMFNDIKFSLLLLLLLLCLVAWGVKHA